MTTAVTFYAYPSQLTPVRTASNANITGTYSNGPANDGVGATFTIAASTLTVDSVVMAVNQDVLLTAQTSGFQNGIYTITSMGATVVLTRRADFQTFDQMKPGYYAPIQAGTEFAGAVFTVVEPQVQVVGTDTVTLINVSSAVTTGTFTNTGLKILDASGLFALTMSPGSTLTAARTFTFTTGDAARTLDISAANVTVSTFGATLVDDASAAAAATTLGLGTASDVAFASLTVANTGLHILDTNATHDLIIAPGSNLTADRTLTVTTGDADRTLDISAASVTVSAFGATLVDDATKLVALDTLGVKRATTAAYGGGGTSNAFTATGLLSTDIVVAVILASTNAVSICKAAPTTDTLTITFSADPGASTTVSWIAIATV